LVLVAASETRIVAEPLIAVEPAHVMRMSAMAGEPMATPLEAVLPVTMPLSLFYQNESASSTC
jgi:hypothetical protein